MIRSFINHLALGPASLALLAFLAHPASAQDAAPALDLPVSSRAVPETPPPVASIPPESEALPGIPDIDFSLDGEASAPATSVAGEARSADSAPAPASAMDARPQASPHTNRPNARITATQADAQAAETAANHEASQAPSDWATPNPTASTDQGSDQGARDVDAPLAKQDGSGINLALGLLLALAALGGAAFLGLRLRRGRAARSGVPESASAIPWDDSDAPLIDSVSHEATDPIDPADTKQLSSVTAANDRPATPTPPLREADPALRTRIPLAGQARPGPATDPMPRQTLVDPPQPSFTRYDKFGLPILAEKPKLSPPRPAPTQPGLDAASAGRRRGPVRYDVMGLPIFE